MGNGNSNVIWAMNRSTGVEQEGVDATEYSCESIFRKVLRCGYCDTRQIALGVYLSPDEECGSKAFDPVRITIPCH